MGTRCGAGVGRENGDVGSRVTAFCTGRPFARVAQPKVNRRACFARPSALKQAKATGPRARNRRKTPARWNWSWPNDARNKKPACGGPWSGGEFDWRPPKPVAKLRPHPRHQPRARCHVRAVLDRANDQRQTHQLHGRPRHGPLASLPLAPGLQASSAKRGHVGLRQCRLCAQRFERFGLPSEISKRAFRPCSVGMVGHVRSLRL
jgi:hypothetical protein